MNELNERLLNEYIDYLKATQKSECTIATYRILLTKFFRELGDKAFTDLKKKDIILYQGKLVNDDMASSSIKTTKGCLSSFANFIQDICDDEFPNYRNPVTRIPNPAASRKKDKTIWENEEVVGLIDKLFEMKRYELGTLVALAYYSGRRKSELPRMKTKDFENLQFNGSMYKTSPIRTKGRCGGKMLEIYVLADFKKYLDIWLEHKVESEWLFPNRYDATQSIGRDAMSYYANQINNMKLVSKHFYWHSLRHLFVTNLLRKGIPSMVVQDIIGWDSADMLKVYSDITKDENISKYFG